MLFNSIEFGFFLPIVFLIYWTIRDTKLKNIFLLAVSYFFYSVWDWRFLFLIIISSAVDYAIGLALHNEKNQKKRKLLLVASLSINIGFLAFFKYFNFFIATFISTFTFFGSGFSLSPLNIILPVGISFYTFQTLSYTLDIYNKKISPTKDIFAFFAFVSFFPQLVAGPIERAKDLLPQFSAPKQNKYSNIRSGFLLIALGLFKKIVIADRLAIFIDTAYTNTEAASGLPMTFAVIFFAFQLYLDFSAYSDMAIGIARILDFKLSTNFKRPYLASSFSDFWSRWHITLSSWFRDYVYIPCGGNRNGTAKMYRNVLIVFGLSGLWHGASWNFVIWGILNGLFLILIDPILQKIKGMKILLPLFIFSAWATSLVFFRAATFPEALSAFSNLGISNSDTLYNFGLNSFEFKLACSLVFANMLLEFIHEKKKNLEVLLLSSPFFIRHAFYLAIVLSIIFLGSYGSGLNDKNFIYFQF